MRTDWIATTLSLTLLLGACVERPEQTATLPEDLTRDLAAASASSGDFATAPRSAPRMRFVSDIEQTKPSVPAKRPTISHHPAPAAASHHEADDEAADEAVDEATDVATDPVESMASPDPVSTSESPAPEPPAVIAQQPSPEPASAPAGSTSGGNVGESGRGVGLGGLLGGIIGAVIIRGGDVGRDKCHPRRDGRDRPIVIGRPDFGMPLPTGGIFPVARRR
jgi:hypothetical protein